jgi:hypothetical protein
MKKQIIAIVSVVAVIVTALLATNAGTPSGMDVVNVTERECAQWDSKFVGCYMWTANADGTNMTYSRQDLEICVSALIHNPEVNASMLEWIDIPFCAVFKDEVELVRTI